MKSIVKEDNKQIEYPCLMVGEETGVIILAYRDTPNGYIEGVVVNKGNGERSVGCIYDRWNKDRFTLFKGIIELSND